jgi:hypothetical protein
LAFFVPLGGKEVKAMPIIDIPLKDVCIDLAEIQGAHEQDGSVCCPDCCNESDPDWRETINEENIIYMHDLDNPKKLYICDRCKQELCIMYGYK